MIVLMLVLAAIGAIGLMHSHDERWQVFWAVLLVSAAGMIPVCKVVGVG